jgi:predicted nucleic acid-binding protein
MAGTVPKKRFALDTNLLIDLADEKDFAHTFREVFQEKGVELVVPPTVVHELAYFASGDADSADSEVARLSHHALACMREWKLQAYDLISVGHGITEQFTKRLMSRGLLPDDEWNDGQILAESALHFCSSLVTSDGDLLGIPEAALVSVFDEFDLPSVQVCHPRKLARACR